MTAGRKSPKYGGARPRKARGSPQRTSARGLTNFDTAMNRNPFDTPMCRRWRCAESKHASECKRGLDVPMHVLVPSDAGRRSRLGTIAAFGGRGGERKAPGVRGAHSRLWPEIISYLNPSCCFTESMSPSTQRLVILSPSIPKKAAPDHEISRPEGATPKNWPRCTPANRIRAAARCPSSTISSIVQVYFDSAVWIIRRYVMKPSGPCFSSPSDPRKQNSGCRISRATTSSARFHTSW